MTAFYRKKLTRSDCFLSERVSFLSRILLT